MEPDTVRSFRQLLSIVVGEDDLLDNVINYGRIRTMRLDSMRLLMKITSFIDYNIKKLGIEDVEAEMQKLKTCPPAEGLRIRVKLHYRDELLRWRFAFKKKFTPPEMNAFFNAFPTLPGVDNKEMLLASRCLPHEKLMDDYKFGCLVCGAQSFLKKCSRCKYIQYCSAAHQKLDWKKHKKECQPPKDDE
eukprot:m.25992 g.25992  ORF g.25992 m.25992 type:complete len:189 (-) comp7756_c0_seq2:113-679(-)